MNFHNFLLLVYLPSTAMETLKTSSEYSVDINRGFQGFSMANLEKGSEGSLLWFLFCLILFLTSQSTIFQLCRRIQLRLRCVDPERGWQKVLTPSLENWKPLGLFSNTGPDPLENQKLQSQHSILGNYPPRQRFAVGLMMVRFQ